MQEEEVSINRCNDYAKIQFHNVTVKGHCYRINLASMVTLHTYVYICYSAKGELYICICMYEVNKEKKVIINYLKVVKEFRNLHVVALAYGHLTHFIIMLAS